MIFKYLTSIVKPCVFKLFSLRKITKSNFYHHLPTLNIANLFMQSFASSLLPIPHHNPPHTATIPPQKKSQDKNHAPQFTPHFTPRPIERAQLSPIPTPFPPQKPQKGRNYRFTSKTLIIGALGVIGALGHLNNLPASVRFSTHKKISGICVSPKNTHKSEIRVSQAARAHKAGFV